MEIEKLRSLGLSQSEATLYLALLRVGSSEIQPLIEETGFYKANIYETLERLCEKGVISKIIENGKRKYQIQRPRTWIDFIQKKKVELDEQEIIAKELAKEVEDSKKTSNTFETASVYRGVSGVKQIYAEIIENKLDYLCFGSPKESSDIIGDFYWDNLHVKQLEYGLKCKMIFHKSLRHWKKRVPEKVGELKFFDDKFEPLTETTVYGTKVAFVVWIDNPIITIIDNAHVAASYRQVFNLLWKIAKK